MHCGCVHVYIQCFFHLSYVHTHVMFAESFSYSPPPLYPSSPSQYPPDVRVMSFLTDRKAAIRLDGHIGSQEKVNIGVPQGSPVVPILFILFTAPFVQALFSTQLKNQELQFEDM